MKKVLFATSALVMTAGVAAAEVAVSGTARMGMIYDGNDVQFSSRARVIFTLTGESDAGLSYGATFRADNAGNANNGTAGQVWISGAYGKLSMGDTVSASEAAVGDLYSVGYTEGSFAGDIEEITYLTGDMGGEGQGPNVLYEYTIDQISLYASASDGSGTEWDTTVGGGDDETRWSLAAKYDAGNWSAGLGYARSGDAKEISLGAEAQFNQFAVKGIYVKYDDASGIAALRRAGADALADELDVLPGAAFVEHEYTAGLAAAYQADALVVKAFWRQDKFENTLTGASAKADSYGIGADYDLGGGAVLAGGIIDTDYLDDTVADLGIRFQF